MELTTIETPAKVVKTLTQNSPIAAGQDFELKVGGDELSEVVPAGKQWLVRMEIHITETDA